MQLLFHSDRWYFFGSVIKTIWFLNISESIMRRHMSRLNEAGKPLVKGAEESPQQRRAKKNPTHLFVAAEVWPASKKHRG